MQTFFKICPPQFIDRHSEQDGITILKNGSTILWMHLDAFDEQSLRGLEINSAFIDQAEEISEGIYLVLDSRIGRWDKAVVPDELLEKNHNWPITDLGNYKVPNYMMLGCNPDTQFHWLYRKYHPESVDRLEDHLMIQAPTDPTLGDPETYKQMLTRDPEWIAKYVMGTWGVSEAQIHILPPESILEATPDLISLINRKAALFRILDHGDTSPTCCLWVAALKGIYIFFREYYLPNALISTHRQNIYDLSQGENYVSNYADPSIFHKKSQREGGFWTVADEYLTSDLKSPPLVWLPADNNELSTRNRINELLALSPYRTHPVTGQNPAPGIYFIRKTLEYPYGCTQSINQLKSQRREKIGDYNGKIIYSDEREKSIVDHAYDCIRYMISMHGIPRGEPARRAPKRSFINFNRLRNAGKMMIGARV